MNNTQSLQEGTNNSNLLRKALQGNALFSGLSGLASFFAAQWLAQFTGIHEPLVFVVLGVILIVFAVDLAWLASRESPDRRLVWVVILLDVAWVAGSAAILNQTSTIYIILLARVFLKEPLTRRRLLACLLALSGALCVVLG